MKKSIIKYSNYKHVTFVISKFILLKNTLMFKNPSKYGIKILSDKNDSISHSDVKWQQCDMDERSFREIRKKGAEMHEFFQRYINLHNRFSYLGIRLPGILLWHLSYLKTKLLGNV